MSYRSFIARITLLQTAPSNSIVGEAFNSLLIVCFDYKVFHKHITLTSSVVSVETFCISLHD